MQVVKRGKLYDFHLDVVGDGPLRNELEKLSESLGLAEFVDFMGAQEENEVQRYLQGVIFSFYHV